MTPQQKAESLGITFAPQTPGYLNLCIRSGNQLITSGHVSGLKGKLGAGLTTEEGYAAAKLFKGGFRSNNLDPNARHCMASAVAGFMRTFGIDEPMGCYDDIEQADAFVLWGSNMAEMHPVLWSRITDRRLSNPNTRVVVLSTFEHRSFDLAEQSLTRRSKS